MELVKHSRWQNCRMQVVFAVMTTWLCTGCYSIKLLDVNIPPHAIQGQDTKLVCNYDLEGDNLYSVKWYRNGHEFYRYIPTDEPSTTIFRQPGIDVDDHRSTETTIHLRNVDLRTTGQYRCEVSGEAPLFLTAARDAILIIVDLPDEGPIIAGGQPRYNMGDNVNVNCTSLRSNPAAKLKWYINGEEADPAIIKNYQVIKEHSGLETSVLGLRFKVREKHFKTGDMKLKCTATIATIYWRSNEESVQGVRNQNTAFTLESRRTWDSAAIPIHSSANSNQRRYHLLWQISMILLISVIIHQNIGKM